MKNTNYINRLIHSNNLLLYLIITFIFVIITGKLWWEFKDISAAIGCSIIIPFGVMILKEVIYNVSNDNDFRNSLADFIFNYYNKIIYKAIISNSK